jgi:hypothetical protein
VNEQVLACHSDWLLVQDGIEKMLGKNVAGLEIW